MTTSDISGAVSDVVSRMVALDAEIAERTEQRAALRSVLLTLLPGPGAFNVDGTKVTVREYRRFDPKRAAEYLEPFILERISKPVPDAATARAELPGEIYDECCGPASFSVGLK